MLDRIQEEVPYGNAVFLMRFQVITAVSMKMAVFWNAAPCSLLEIDSQEVLLEVESGSSKL
jgi:hypothetical protein